VGGSKGAIQFQERGDFIGASTMPPCRSLPKRVAGNGGEVVVRPPAFSLGDGLSQRFDGIFARPASDGGDSSEGGLTVYVPPSKAPEVWHVPTFEQLPRDSVNVCVEGICSTGKGGDVRDIRRR